MGYGPDSSRDRPRARGKAYIAVAIPAVLLACAVTALAARATSRSASKPARPAAASVAASVASTAAEWPMASGTWQNTRYSSLEQINSRNAFRLALAWTFHTGVMKGQEAAPIVVGSRLYVVTPFPNKLMALDLAHSGTPIWTYEPKPLPVTQGIACCDVVNRGAAFDKGRLFFNTLDGQTCAVDASTGRELWKVRIGDIHKGETMTMAPLVANGRVYVGNSSGEPGVRGWLKALDAESGRVLWTAHSTGPDGDVRIGREFKPHYPQDRGTDLGVRTWPPDRWQSGGGNVWGFIAYDPDRDCIYHGTGNPGAWDQALRPGDNKWTCGVFARDAATGAARWFYQWSPHDRFDHDGINENVLVDLPWKGAVRPLLIHPDRNGYLYVLDRTTGEVLSATPYVRVTTSRGVNIESGRLIPNDIKTPGAGKIVRDVAPASPGAKDWQPSAFSPRTGLLYVPHQTLAMDFEGTEVNYVEGTPYVGSQVKTYAAAVTPGSDNRGAFTAWDPIHARAEWSIPEPFPVRSGALATAGDVVFYGTIDGWFKAVDARTGRLLWNYKTESGIIGQPVTYLGPDGKQYIAVLAGVGSWSDAIVSASLDADRTAAAGFGNATQDRARVTGPGDLLYVFAVP